jgi:hypothetical protein
LGQTQLREPVERLVLRFSRNLDAAMAQAGLSDGQVHSLIGKFKHNDAAHQPPFVAGMHRVIVADENFRRCPH